MSAYLIGWYGVQGAEEVMLGLRKGYLVENEDWGYFRCTLCKVADVTEQHLLCSKHCTRRDQFIFKREPPDDMRALALVAQTTATLPPLPAGPPPPGLPPSGVAAVPPLAAGPPPGVAAVAAATRSAAALANEQLRSEVQHLLSEVQQLRSEVQPLRSEVQELRSELQAHTFAMADVATLMVAQQQSVGGGVAPLVDPEGRTAEDVAPLEASNGGCCNADGGPATDPQDLWLVSGGGVAPLVDPLVDV
jgi:outer membrane murein-binding lipoprotein Lpp